MSCFPESFWFQCLLMRIAIVVNELCRLWATLFDQIWMILLCVLSHHRSRLRCLTVLLKEYVRLGHIVLWQFKEVWRVAWLCNKSSNGCWAHFDLHCLFRNVYFMVHDRFSFLLQFLGYISLNFLPLWFWCRLSLDFCGRRNRSSNFFIKIFNLRSFDGRHAFSFNLNFFVPIGTTLDNIFLLSSWWIEVYLLLNSSGLLVTLFLDLSSWIWKLERWLVLAWLIRILLCL